MPTDPRKLEAHAGACPYCGTSPKDGYVIRNFMGVSFKAECAQGHRWTRQKVEDDAADQPFADKTAVEIAPARHKGGSSILAAENAEAAAYADRTSRWWRWIQARLWEWKERHDNA